MKLQEIKFSLRMECCCLRPLTFGLCIGAAVLLGALVTANPFARPIGIFLPRTVMHPFLHILFQLIAYAIFGGALAALLCMPTPKARAKRMRLCKLGSILLFASILILSYVWLPLVCRAGSYFLGVLLCFVILCALFVLFFTVSRVSIISAGLTAIYAIWTIYLLYLSLSLLFFA